jgi:nitrate/nitrite transporter NarK
VRAAKAPPVMEVLRFMFLRSSFLHLCLAAGLHSVVWYASGAFNNAFFQRSHGMSASQAGYWISFFSIVGGVGTFAGGFLADRLSRSRNDRRWYLWVPGIATLLCVPFQFGAYLGGDMSIVLPMFGAMQFMAAVFFGPSFAMTQSIATRMRSGSRRRPAAAADTDRPGHRAVAGGLHQRHPRRRWDRVARYSSSSSAS